MKYDFEPFRKNLKMLIDARGYYANDIAEAIGLAPSTLYRYMSGARTPEIGYIIRMAQFFNVSVDWLLGVNNDRIPKEYDSIKKLAHSYALATPEDKKAIDFILKKYS